MGYYEYGQKRIHRYKGQPSLAMLALRDGTLDVDLSTGRPINSQGRTMKTRIDKDGYVTFVLTRKVTHGGKVVKDRAGRKRRRKLMTVFVHRLVAMKAIAVERHGAAWREHVQDIPGNLDVNHLPHPQTGEARRWDNRAKMLRVESMDANHRRRPMTAEEEAAVIAAINQVYEPAF